MITVTHLVIGSLITVRLVIGFMITFDHLATASTWLQGSCYSPCDWLDEKVYPPGDRLHGSCHPLVTGSMVTVIHLEIKKAPR
jgi:hypothetical protein